MKATCKFCGRTLDVIMLEKPQFQQHKEELGSINACPGSGQIVATASDDYDGPAEVSVFGKFKGGRGGLTIADKILKASAQAKQQERMPKAAPSWYDREELEEWKW